MTQQPLPQSPHSGDQSPLGQRSQTTPTPAENQSPGASTGQPQHVGATGEQASENPAQTPSPSFDSVQPAPLWQSSQPVPEDLPALPVVPAHVTKEIFNAALKSMLILVAVVLVVGSGLGYLFAGLPGLWAALMAVGVTLIFSGTTIVSMIYTTDKSPNTTMAVVLGAWVGKMAFFVVVLALLSGATFYHKLTFGIIVLVSVFASAILDMRAVIKGRMPYVQPTSH